MAQDREDVPTKERDLQRSSTHSFGICNECGNPIKYPPIKFPISCEEVEQDEKIPSGFKPYNIEYADLHVCCASKKLIESGTVHVEVKSTPTLTPKSWLDKRAVKRVERNNLISGIDTSIEIPTYKHISTNFVKPQ
jgi:hypothetical protein